MKTKNLVGLLLLVFSGLSLIFPEPIFSQEKNPEIQRGLQELKKKKGVSFNVEWHKDKERVKTLEGKLSLPYPGTPEEAVKQFLKDNAAIFQIEPSLHDIEIEDIKESLAGYHIGVKQLYKTLPVFNGGLGIYITKDKIVSTIHSNYLPNIDISTSPTLSEKEIIKIAKNEFRKDCRYSSSKAEKPKPCGEDILKELMFRKEPTPQLGIFEHEGKPYLAYKILLDIEYRESPFALMEYIIDANTGTIFEGGNLIQYITQYVDVTGKVFDPNPVNTLNNTALKDNRDKDDPVFTNTYFLRLLKEVDNSAYFSGRYVYLNDLIEKPLYFRRTSGQIVSLFYFDYTRSQTEFEHINIYYHIDTNQRYIQSLGFTNVNNRAISVDPHGLCCPRADQSYYVPDSIGTGYLAFGEGGVDDAEDADIILHEYGHAIQDNQAPGKYFGCTIEAGAMGEGFGDYWAASNTYNISTTNGFDPACVGEWDATYYSTTNPPCLRRVDSTKQYNANTLIGECHADGEIWSSALWDMFLTLGKTVTDKLILQSHYFIKDLRKQPTFCDGAKAIIDADKQLYNGTNKNIISSIMMNKGIGKTATQFVILDPTDGEVGSPVTVTIEAQNCFGGVVTDYQNDVTLVASGSATGGGLVDIINGVGTIEINDAVAETVTLTLLDTQATGLDVNSTQDVAFVESSCSAGYTSSNWLDYIGKITIDRPTAIVADTDYLYVSFPDFNFGSSIRVYNRLPPYTFVSKFGYSDNGNAFGLAVSDTKIYASYFYGSVVRVFDKVTHVLLREINFNVSDGLYATPLRLAVDSKYLYVSVYCNLYSTSNFCSVVVFDKDTYEYIATLGSESDFGYYGIWDYTYAAMSTVAVDYNYIYVNIATADSYAIRIYDKNSFALVASFVPDISLSSYIQSISVDSSYIFIVAAFNVTDVYTVYVYDKSTFAYVAKFAYSPSGYSVLPDGDVTTTRDGLVITVYDSHVYLIDGKANRVTDFNNCHP